MISFGLAACDERDPRMFRWIFPVRMRPETTLAETFRLMDSFRDALSDAGLVPVNSPVFSARATVAWVEMWVSDEDPLQDLRGRIEQVIRRELLPALAELAVTG